jgi:hypothetical protein
MTSFPNPYYSIKELKMVYNDECYTRYYKKENISKITSGQIAYSFGSFYLGSTPHFGCVYVNKTLRDNPIFNIYLNLNPEFLPNFLPSFVEKADKNGNIKEIFIAPVCSQQNFGLFSNKFTNAQVCVYFTTTDGHSSKIASIIELIEDTLTKTSNKSLDKCILKYEDAKKFLSDSVLKEIFEKKKNGPVVCRNIKINDLVYIRALIIEIDENFINTVRSNVQLYVDSNCKCNPYNQYYHSEVHL